MSNEMKSNDSEPVHRYLVRTLREAPDIVEWMEQQQPDCLQYEMRIVVYFADWYFYQVGRACIEEED